MTIRRNTAKGGAEALQLQVADRDKVDQQRFGAPPEGGGFPRSGITYFRDLDIGQLFTLGGNRMKKTSDDSAGRIKLQGDTVVKL